MLPISPQSHKMEEMHHQNLDDEENENNSSNDTTCIKYSNSSELNDFEYKKQQIDNFSPRTKMEILKPEASISPSIQSTQITGQTSNLSPEMGDSATNFRPKARPRVWVFLE